MNLLNDHHEKIFLLKNFFVGFGFVDEDSRRSIICRTRRCSDDVDTGEPFLFDRKRSSTNDSLYKPYKENKKT